jgi:prephenate dehydratase
VSRPVPPPPVTGADRTSVVAYIADDHPGALLELLTELAVRGVNLTRIESRPTGVGLGRYCFSMDAEGHVAQERVGEALAAMKRLCADVRFLGSYPAADSTPTKERLGTKDADFTAAARWVEALRAGRSAP